MSHKMIIYASTIILKHVSFTLELFGSRGTIIPSMFVGYRVRKSYINKCEIDVMLLQNPSVNIDNTKSNRSSL